MDDDRDDEQALVPLPERFWSFETDGPIERCMVCGVDLLGGHEPYLVEKGFARSEVIFEYGLCLGCHGELVRELSEESLARIQAHFVSRVDIEARRRRIESALDGTAEPWLSHCVLTGEPIDPAGEYQIFGMCLRDQLMLGDLPHAISSAGVEQIMALLSPQTKGFLNDFTGKYFGAPTGADLPTLLPV